LCGIGAIYHYALTAMQIHRQPCAALHVSIARKDRKLS
jgi:hypothetical protein